MNRSVIARTLGALFVCLLVIACVACGDMAPAATSGADDPVATTSSIAEPTAIVTRSREEMTATATSWSKPATVSITPAPRATLVDAAFVRIVDGDTIIVRVGGSDERVRLIGINTPELNKPDGPVECYATEASEQTEALIETADGRIQLERDVSETDQYGRLLRYVWLVTPQGKQLLNEELVEGGYARAIRYRPDVKYQTALNREQSDAQHHERGLWGACE